jgi:hypothetical protein
MTTRERFVNVLTGQPVDRVPFMKVFGGDNAVLPHWDAECPGIAQEIDQLLQFEGGYRGWRITPVNMDPSQPLPVEILEDKEDIQIVRGGDGTVTMVHKTGDYHAHQIDWPIKSLQDWKEYKARHMQVDDPTRWPANWDELVQEYQQRDYPLQLTHRGVYGFPRNRMGDENMAYAFYDQPELMHAIMDDYTDFAIQMFEKQCEHVQFDLIECWEDMAYRSGSLISPKTFREFMTPNFRKLRAFADAHNIPIILVDSDGYIEDLTEVMFESGVNAMYPYEVQSDNDFLRTRERFPGMAGVGCLNKEVMAWGKEAIDAEMVRARRLIEAGRCVPGPDHFVLSNVTLASYRYFMESLREVCLTTTPGR